MIRQDRRSTTLDYSSPPARLVPVHRFRNQLHRARLALREPWTILALPEIHIGDASVAVADGCQELTDRVDVDAASLRPFPTNPTAGRPNRWWGAGRQSNAPASSRPHTGLRLADGRVGGCCPVIWCCQVQVSGSLRGVWCCPVSSGDALDGCRAGDVVWGRVLAMGIGEETFPTSAGVPSITGLSALTGRVVEGESRHRSWSWL